VDLADKAANSYTKEFLFGQTDTDRSILQLIDEALHLLLLFGGAFQLEHHVSEREIVGNCALIVFGCDLGPCVAGEGDELPFIHLRVQQFAARGLRQQSGSAGQQQKRGERNGKQPTVWSHSVNHNQSTGVANNQ